MTKLDTNILYMKISMNFHLVSYDILKSVINYFTISLKILDGLV